MKDTEVAWLAGLFEGEGNIYLGSTAGKNHFGSLQITIAMTDLDVIDRVDALYPGKRYIREYTDKWKTCYIWRLYGSSGFNFLRLILPYLGERRSAKANEMLALESQINQRFRNSEAKSIKAKELRTQGMTYKQIADTIGVSKGYVPRLLEREVS